MYLPICMFLLLASDKLKERREKRSELSSTAATRETKTSLWIELIDL